MFLDGCGVKREADKDHGIVRCAVAFGAQNVVSEVDGVVRHAVNLRNTTKCVRILNFATVRVAVSYVRWCTA